jgi:uncharacterized membrane protein
MPAVEESVIVNKPRAEVFAYAADSTHYLDWVTTVVQFEATPASPFRADTTVKGVSRVAGRNSEFAAKMAEFEDGVVFTLQSVESAWPFSYSYRFEDVAEGTRVTFRNEFGLPGGIVGKLTEPVVARMYSHGVKANLANLKALLEG